MKPLDRINGYAHVAVRYGLEEAIFLDSIMYWYKENRANQRNFHDGRWWTFNSARAFAELFPWWTAKQLRRILASCKDQGALLSGNYNEDQRDRTLWYTPGDELLTLYNYSEAPETGESIFPDGKIRVTQPGKCNIDHVNTHVNTDPPRSPTQNPKAENVEDIFRAYAGEDRELGQLLEDFLETRRKIKKPLHTQKAVKIFLNKLDKLSAGDRAVKLALLENAILHDWASVYPLKPDETPNTETGGAVRPEGGRYI